MPSMALPGLMMPAQFGPTIIVPAVARIAHQVALHPHHVLSRDAVGDRADSLMPASAASMMASAQKAGATKVMRCVGAGLLDRFLHGVEQRHGRDGWPPPLPGVTPPTTLVPYSIISFAWKVPLSPVMPWTMTGVFSSIRMLITCFSR